MMKVMGSGHISVFILNDYVYTCMTHELIVDCGT